VRKVAVLHREFPQGSDTIHGVPSLVTPVTSMGLPASKVRHLPTASKFSMASPIGSKTLWHAAQLGLA